MIRESLVECEDTRSNINPPFHYTLFLTSVSMSCINEFLSKINLEKPGSKID